MTASLPFAWGVLYAHPNLDGSRKNCGNCVFWTADRGGRCVIHPADLKVAASAVCGYHIFGQPFGKWIDLPLEPVDPAFSGLEEVGKGTVCKSCRYFEAVGQERGLCWAVAHADRKAPEAVESMGCCARWEKA